MASAIPGTIFWVQKMAAHALCSPPTTTTRFFQLHSESSDQFSPTQKLIKTHTHALHTPWLGAAISLCPRSSNVTPLIPKRPSIKATVVFSLPTSNPERVASTDKVPKWSSKAIKSFVMAELEARKLKYPTTGTEAFIMGILIEGTNFASKVLRANGITLLKVREEIVKLLGKADMYFFSPEHPPLTEDAQRALDWAIDEKLKSGNDGEVTTTHLLLGVWSQEESPGHKMLADFGFNDEKAKELKSVISEPKFMDD